MYLNTQIRMCSLLPKNLLEFQRIIKIKRCFGLSSFLSQDEKRNYSIFFNDVTYFFLEPAKL